MKIASLNKQSFIDWEGKTTAVIFTSGCNFRCGYCHNPSLVLPHLIHDAELISEASILNYLHSRQGWLDGLVIGGGEPTIQPDLFDFITAVKELGYPVKLDTNGSNPHVVEQLIDNGLIDYVALDIKALLTRYCYQKVTGIKCADLITNVKRTLTILRSAPIDYQLRTTIVPALHNEYTINKLQLLFSSENYVQQAFRDGETIEKHLQPV